MPSTKTELHELQTRLKATRRRFNRACDQIVLLNAKLGDINQRYVIGKHRENQYYRRTLQMRIITVEGLVKTFTHYASMKAEEMLDLRQQIADLKELVELQRQLDERSDVPYDWDNWNTDPHGPEDDSSDWDSTDEDTSSDEEASSDED